MCGITGFLNFDQKTFSLNILQTISDSISHRGPDGNGAILCDVESGLINLSSGDVGLAHNRLAIIDLSQNAAQPMIDPEEQFILVFNGEIYNYKELREELVLSGHRFNTSSDTETILYSYKQWGIDCVHHLTGMFAFAIWDRRTKTMHIARDRLGIKPIYYYTKGGRFSFSSELKALIKFPNVSKEINYNALSDYFETRYIPGPDSILQNISKLEPGNYLSITKQDISKTQYWSVPENSSRFIEDSESSITDQLDSLLNSVVKQHLVGDVAVGSFLSGGIDSSLVTAIAQRNSSKKIKTFTIGFSDDQFNEAPNASKIAQHLGTDHHEHYITERDVLQTLETLYKHYDEPFGDASAMPTLCLSKYSSKIFKTVLSGDGGDELFHGYRWFQQIEKSRKLSNIPLFLRKLLINKLVTNVRELQSLSGLREKEFAALISQKQAVFQDWERDKLIGTHHGYYINQLHDAFPIKPSSRNDLYGRLSVLGLNTWLPDDFLVKVDRASMAYGLEVRVPLLDHRVVELAMKIHPSLKTRGDSSKYLLQQILARYVPRNLYEREKKGFSVPLAKWLNGYLRPFVFDTLSPTNIRRHGVLNEKAVSELLVSFRKRPDVEALRVWLVLNFQMWCTEYLG